MSRADVLSRAVLFAEDDIVKSRPFTQLIAYMSLCMLTASFGAMVGPVWGRWWAICGAFGLASSLGLDILNRSRTLRTNETRRQRLAMEAEQKLNAIMDDLEARDAIHDALRRLQLGAADPTRQGDDGQPEPRRHCNKPAIITRLFRSSKAPGYRRGEPVAGLVRSLSRHGFALAHNQRLERGIVLLECTLDNGAPLQFVADVLWCEVQERGGYCSGGRFLEALSQPAPIPSACHPERSEGSSKPPPV